MAKQTGSIDLRPFKEAGEKAAATNQYFWYKDGTDTEAGAHVTEIPQADFETTPAGGNILMRSNGIKIRNALINLAQFLGSEVILGEPTKPNIHLNTNGLEFYDGSVKKGTIRGGTNAITIYNTSSVTLGNDYVEINSNGNGIMTINTDGAIIGDNETYPDTTPLQVTGKATLGAMDPGIFEVESAQLFASSNIAANNHKYGTVTVSKAGYYPLAIAGWNSPDMRYFVPDRLRLTAQSTGSATVGYDVYNAHTSAHSGAFNVDILWLKVTA